ncbi:MAG: site-specific integrase, partial [bacterium]|nr:site-specific integrase [bacterium]
MIALPDAVNDFLFHCRVEKNLSKLTLQAYKSDLNQFGDFLSTHQESIDIEKIDKHVLRKYLQRLLDANKAKTVKRKIASLKALFNFLEFEDKIAGSPFRKMKVKIKEPLQLPGVLTLEEIKTLFQAVYKIKQECNDRSAYAYKTIVRNSVVLELLMATGIRVSELCNLKKNNVNLDQKYIQVFGKGRRE